MTGALLAALLCYTIIVSLIALVIDDRAKMWKAEYDDLSRRLQKRDRLIKSYDNALKECYDIIDNLRKGLDQ